MKLKSLPVVALALALACVVASGTPAPGRVAASEASYPVTERSFAVGDGYVQTISLLLSSDVDQAEAASAADSFFARQRPVTEDKPGRRYVGICAPGASRPSVLIRVYVAQLRAAWEVLGRQPGDDADAYMTLIGYFNSLRELGNTVSLLESDVPDYLTGLVRRDGIDPRWPNRTMELTSRRRSDEIPKAIEQLQVRYVPGQERQEAIDICLASNIIEVGVDIDRLGLMTIVGMLGVLAALLRRED